MIGSQENGSGSVPQPQQPAPCPQQPAPLPACVGGVGALAYTDSLCPNEAVCMMRVRDQKCSTVAAHLLRVREHRKLKLPIAARHRHQVWSLGCGVEGLGCCSWVMFMPTAACSDMHVNTR